MKRNILAIISAAAILVAGLCSTSCINVSHTDVLLSKSKSCEYSKTTSPKPGVSISEVDAVVAKVWARQDCEHMGEFLVLRNQSSSKVADNMARRIGAEIEQAVKQQWNDISSELSEECKSLSYSISHDFSEKPETVWTYTIR